MKSKEKRGKKIKFTLKRAIYLFAIISCLISIYAIYNFSFLKNRTYAIEVDSKINEIQIKKASGIDLEKIIEENNLKDISEQLVVEELELEYITKYETNDELSKGTVQVIQEGREGKQQITKKKTYENDELVAEEQISTKIIKASINKIVEVGIGKSTNKHKVNVGDNVYVTSDRLSVMSEATEESEKITTLSQNIKLTVMEIQGEWYKITSGSTIGFVKSECTAYENQKTVEQEESLNEKSKQEIIPALNFEMALNKPSGLSVEQFKKVLLDSKDVNNIFADNAQYFYYIEKQYNINGIFVAAVGIHESAWGTSKIAQNKFNLFGYGAYDSNPYNGAYTFSNYSECIDLVSRVFVKYYLNPKGTSIYGGEQALGTYYSGATLTAVNNKYASDKNWANAVYTHIKYLYNKL